MWLRTGLARQACGVGFASECCEWCVNAIMAVMTLWTVCAGVLYTEMALISVLLVPMPRSFRRKLVMRVTGSNLAKKLHSAFLVIFFFIVSMFLQSTRESSEAGTVYSESNRDDVLASLNIRMRMFRAQRNFFLSGGSLFLLLVLNRFYSFIVEMGSGMDVELLKKQAIKNNEEFLKILEERDNFSKRATRLEGELKAVNTDRTALESQAKNTETAYLAITDELKSANAEMDKLRNTRESKKSE